MRVSANETATYISECLQLALLLEVSAYPKPGNIHRTADFPETRYEQFLASAVALGRHFREAAMRGVLVSKRKIRLNEVGVGETIRNAVFDMTNRQRGGNTGLGSILLLSPIAVAAGMTVHNRSISPRNLRKAIRMTVESTTAKDAVAVYDAILAAKPGGLGKVSKLDIRDSNSKTRILREKLTLLNIFEMASNYDSIASEWAKNYTITFDLGYPYFTQQLRETKDINVATVHVFLKILSEVPDSLIVRKVSIDKAREVSKTAREILGVGALMSEEGRRRLKEFDEKLRTPSHELNPGTTADLTASVLSIAILGGYKP